LLVDNSLARYWKLARMFNREKKEIRYALACGLLWQYVNEEGRPKVVKRLQAMIDTALAEHKAS
jgi:hypothetical protein